MEEESKQKHTARKLKKTKDGTMSFIDHLDELRKRLIRFLIVMMICVLACYGFRKEILDLIKKPVDAPLKKYTSTQYYEKQAAAGELPSLKSYDCSCTELDAPVPVSGTSQAESETRPQDQPAITETAKQAADSTADIKQPAAEQEGSGGGIDSFSRVLEKGSDAVKGTVNDFVIFFQVLLNKEPSPVFETAAYKARRQQEQLSRQSMQAMPGELNLNCQCKLSALASTANDTGSSMVFIGLPELFFAQMKVAIFAGFFIAFPYMLIEIWGFVGPALYRSEKRIFWIFAIFSYLFFIGGALFGYFVVFPYGFDFFLSLTQMGEIMPNLSVGEYLSFALKLLMAFGFIFELPLATFILARMGVITPGVMIKQARIALLVIFCLSAMLTPPDPFTMVLMAGPLMLLYFISIGVCFVGLNRKKASWRAQGIDDEDID